MMTIDDAIELVQRLSVATKHLPTGFTYQVFTDDTNTHRPGAPFWQWFREWHKILFGAATVSAPEITDCYGVYVIAEAANREVVYIGKATPNNYLAAEMMTQIQAKRAADGTVEFSGGKRLFKKPRLTPSQRQAVLTGDLLVALVQIDPWACAAHVESYLHAAAFITCDGQLPAGNDRIG